MTTLQTQSVNGHAAGFEHLREVNDPRAESEAWLTRDVEVRARQAHQHQLAVLAMARSSLRAPVETMRQAAALLEHAHDDRSLLSRLRHVIERQLAHLSTLIDEVQDVAGAKAGDACNQRGTVDLIDLLCLAGVWSRSRLAARNQVLVRQAPSGAPRVRGDAVRLRQAFSRLLEHASAHMPPGGEITLSAQEWATTVTVTMADSGFAPGPLVPCRSLDAPAHPPYAMSRDNHGSGTALDEVRELIRAYGGSIAASSAGTDRFGAFVVTLPKA